MAAFRRRIGAAICGAILLTCQSRAAEEPQVLASSASGHLRIEEPVSTDNASEEWVVSTADPAVRARLGVKRDAQPAQCFISPDERWIAATYHLGSGMAAAELFRWKAGVQFVPAHERATIGQMLWQFYDHSTGRRGEAEAGRQDEARGIVDFIAWSPDAARGLFALRGGERRGAGIYHWGAYYNLRSGKWELTDYLRVFNNRAAARWSGSLESDEAFDLFSAEAVDPLPAEAILQARLDACDRALNAVYRQILQGKTEPEKDGVRQRQRGWIAQRDRGAKAFAQAGRKEEASRRRLQYLTDVTNAKLVEWKRELESPR